MKFSELIRKNTIACNKKCGGTIKYPFRINTAGLYGKQELCFGDCLNINLEKGPWLKTLGEVPEDSVPKKFVWGHSM